MRTVGVVTTSRSDYGIYRPILRKIQDDRELDLMLFVSGMHLSPRFGMTVNEIKRDGFPITQTKEISLELDTPKGMSEAMGATVTSFAEIFENVKPRPDILLMVGDRFEVFAAAAASLPFNIPLAHIHGGELTEGSIDNSFRHAITKMSHLHFTSTQTYADRLIRHLGEEPWRVTVSGAPALDEMKALPPPDASVFEKTYGLRVSQKPLLVTFHPVMLELDDTKQQVEELLKALDQVGMPVIFTQPNADAGGRLIQDLLERYVKEHKDVWYVPNFGQRGYWDAMLLCAAMVGNSSSGIIEAPSFGVPVVNIGTRQAGRVRAANVIDVTCERGPIQEAIARAVSPEFRIKLKDMVNPYKRPDVSAADVIVAKLKSVELGDKLLRKIFHDDGATR